MLLVGQVAFITCTEPGNPKIALQSTALSVFFGSWLHLDGVGSDVQQELNHAQLCILGRVPVRLFCFVSFLSPPHSLQS